jgi:hypothetical protein
MFGEVRIHLFFGVPKICFNPAFVDPPTEELAPRSAIRRVVEEAQPADLKYVVLFRSTLWETGALKFPNRA